MAQNDILCFYYNLFLVFKMFEAKRFVNSQRALPALSLSSKFCLSRRPYAINLRENGSLTKKHTSNISLSNKSKKQSDNS